MEVCRKKIFSAGIYARLSVDHGDGKAESIEAQIELAKEWLKRQPDIRLYGCYRDLGKTGTNFMREGFEHLMEDVRKGLVDCIIVKDFSRLGRNYIETGNYLETIFPFLGVRFISITDGYDSLRSAESDALGVELKQLVNELYAKDIGLKVKASRRIKWERGEYAGGIAPYGYRRGQKDGRKTLQIEAAAAAVVRELFERYARGESQKGLIVWLYGQRIHRPGDYQRSGHVFCEQGEVLRQWDRGTIKSILQNPVYLGRLVRAERNDTGASKAKTAEAPAGVLVKEHTHEAIISEELFDLAAERFERQTVYCNQKGFSRREPEDENPLEGLLFCGECQKGMARAASVRPAGAGGSVRTYTYYCPNSDRIDRLSCGKKRLPLRSAMTLLREGLIKEIALAGIIPDRLVSESRKRLEAEQAVLLKRRELTGRREDGERRRASEKYLQYRQGILSREAFLGWKQEAEARGAEWSRRCLEYDKEIQAMEKQWEDRKIFLRRLFCFEEEAKPDAAFWKALIGKIIVYPQKRLEIVYRFPAAWESAVQESAAWESAIQEPVIRESAVRESASRESAGSRPSKG